MTTELRDRLRFESMIADLSSRFVHLESAAVGALIGEIASDDAGKGAAWGALGGAVIARRRTAHAKAEASHEVEQQSQQAQQATAEQIENFKGLAGTFDFKGNSGEGIHEMRVYKIIDGKYIEIEQ